MLPRPTTILITGLLSGLLTCAAPFAAAFSKFEDAILDAEQQEEVLEELSSVLLRQYVRPDKAQLIVASIANAQVEGAFSSSQSIADFVQQVNALLQTASSDRHLGLLMPERFQQVWAMFYGDERVVDQVKAQAGERPESHSGSPAHSGSSVHGATGGHAQRSSSSREQNAAEGLSAVGVSRVSEISRDGLNQTGYLALERFDGSPRSLAFIERVFSTFTESDNIILDLRSCGGGDAEMVLALSSYFFDQPTHLLTTTLQVDETGKRPEVERWTTPNQLSARFANKKLKILISEQSFSAAESFAFGMKAVRRAELVGETTGGGGYTNDFVALPHHLGASISVGRTFDPRTGKDWQGVGVVPDIEIDPEHALITALSSFTQASGKLDRLQGEERAIYRQLQSYANAWYGADPKTMAAVISQNFLGISRDQSGAEVERLTRQELLEQTAEGRGTRSDQIYYNRIIRDIQYDQQRATVTLILRETVHQMALSKAGSAWLIQSDDVRGKIRG